MIKNIQDIIRDREIIKMKNLEFLGLEYEEWNVSLPVFGDQVESLLEHGFSVSILDDGFITVTRIINPSPQKLQENKRFWRCLSEIIVSNGD